MDGDETRRNRRLRKTKAELIAELEGLEAARDSSAADDLVQGIGIGPGWRFNALLDNAPMAIFMRDVEGRYVRVNKAYEVLYRVNGDEIRGKMPADVFAPESAEQIMRHHREVLETSVKIQRESRVQFLDGGSRFQQITMFPLIDPSGEPVGVCGVLMDLSETKRAEQAADVSQQRLLDALDSMQEAFCLYDADDKLIAANEKMFEIRPLSREIMARGGTLEDMLREHAKLGLFPDAKGRIEEFVKERLASHRSPSAPFIHQLSDGTWWMLNVTLTSEGGSAVSVIDITNLKEAEESRNRLAVAVESVPMGIALFDSDDRLIFCNQRYRELVSAVEDMLVPGTSFLDIFHAVVARVDIPQARGREESFIKARLEHREDPKGPFSYYHGDKWLQIDETRLPDGSIFNIISDRTEQKRAEDALRKSDALFRAVVSHSPHKIHIKDVEGRYILINREAEKLFGISDEDGRGKSSYDLFDKDTADAFMAHDRAVIDSGRSLEEEEEFTLDDGVHTFLTVKFPIYDLDGVVAVGAIGTDITDRKKAEAALRETAAIRQSEEHLRQMFETSPAGVAIISVNDDRRLYVNPAMVKLFGAETADRLLAADLRSTYADPADLDKIRAGKGDKFITEIEVERIGLDGHRWWCILHRRMIEYEGQPALIAWHYDITERRRAEDEFRRLNEMLEQRVEERTRELSIEVSERKQAEERFRDLAESTSDWMWEMDADLRFSYFSERYSEIRGSDPRNRIGTRRGDYALKEDLAAHPEKWVNHDRDLAQRRPFRDFEYMVHGEGSRILWISVSGSPIFDGRGEFLGYRGTGTDITARKAAEEALQESQARLANVLDNSPTPIYFKDTQCRFILANRRYLELYGVSLGDVQGRNSSEIFGADVGTAFLEHDKEVLSSREIIEREEEIFGRTYLTLKFPVVDPSGELLGLGGIETDVSEIKQAQKQLRTAKEEAEFANRAKTEFLANMSHELRTPLNSILGFSEILMTETFGALGNDRYKDYIGDIHQSGTHLLELISEVLDLSKLEAGELHIFESEIDVTDAVRACVKMVEGRASADHASVTTSFSNHLPYFKGDERRLKQILLNLLGNAIKFTPSTGEIVVSARVSDKGRFTIEVADSGIGIAPEDIPKVLEPFGQVREAFTRNHEGTGLGLYLAKSFTEMHGGTFDIASDVGKGTTVTLCFPPERTIAGPEGAAARA